MKHESTLGRKIRLPLTGLLAAMAVSLSAWAYWPCESISVTSHYDATARSSASKPWVPVVSADRPDRREYDPAGVQLQSAQ